MKQFLLPLLILATGCTVVSPGERGIGISQGEINKEVRKPGTYLWIPHFRGSAVMDVQIQKSDIESGAATKDQQELMTKVAVNWQIEESKVVEIYENLGNLRAVLTNVIEPQVHEVMKACVSKMSAEEVLSKRQELKEQMDAALKARLSPYGITIRDVSIINFEFGKEYKNAIEQKQVAEQKAKQAEYEAQKAEQDARAAINTARGQAESQKLVQQTLTPLMIELKKVEKWDGKLPTTILGNTTPMINVK